VIGSIASRHEAELGRAINYAELQLPGFGSEDEEEAQ
jgi:hypothetical protein